MILEAALAWHCGLSTSYVIQLLRLHLANLQTGSSREHPGLNPSQNISFSSSTSAHTAVLKQKATETCFSPSSWQSLNQRKRTNCHVILPPSVQRAWLTAGQANVPSNCAASGEVCS